MQLRVASCAIQYLGCHTVQHSVVCYDLLLSEHQYDKLISFINTLYQHIISLEEIVGQHLPLLKSSKARLIYLIHVVMLCYAMLRLTD